MTALAYQRHGVSAVLATADGRYLMQLRDDRPDIVYPGYWCLFGGTIEPGEAAEEAILRELEEELAFTPARAALFVDMVTPIRARGRMVHERQVYFLVPVTPEEVAGMELREGAAMRLMTLAEVLAEPRIVPPEICGLLYHATGALG